MTICLVTDRRRADPRHQARSAAEAGIDLLQIRERDLGAAALAALVREALELTRGSRTRIVVNDRVDVALAADADGVHLRGDSIPVAAARSLAPAGFVIGRSVHSVADASAADAADLLIAGTVFPTPSKPGAPCLGADGLRLVVQAARPPVLAIGGITLETIEAVARAGADGIAAIGLFADARRMDALVRQVRARFDTAKPAPYH